MILTRLFIFIYRAAFASAPSGLIPASFLIMLMGIIFGYYFLLIVSTIIRLMVVIDFMERMIFISIHFICIQFRERLVA